MAAPNLVPKLYQSVVDDVINNVREAFLDEGVDEQILQELKQLWTSKMHSSKALDPVQPEIDSIIPAHVLMQQTQPLQQQPQHHQQTLQTIQMPFQQSAASQAAAMALPAGLFQQQFAQIGQVPVGGITLQPAGNGHYIAVQTQQPQQAQAAGQLPISTIQQPMLQAVNAAIPHVHQLSQNRHGVIHLDGDQKIVQFDGQGDSSSSDDEYDDENDDDDNDDEKDEEEEGEEEEPLNSNDDVSDEDPIDVFETDNVIVCQFDKINRNKNKWKFHLKDGVMNLNSRDYVFQKAIGEAEW